MLHTAIDDLDHLRLNIFRIHDAIWSNAAREADFHPSAASSYIGDRSAVGDADGIHDLFRLRPVLAIGRFQQTEILRGKKSRVLWLGGWLRSLRRLRSEDNRLGRNACGRGREKNGDREDRMKGLHRERFFLACVD